MKIISLERISKFGLKDKVVDIRRAANICRAERPSWVGRMSAPQEPSSETRGRRRRAQDLQIIIILRFYDGDMYSGNYSPPPPCAGGTADRNK